MRIDLKAALARREPVIGTWQKTPSSIVTEILALSNLQVVCLDAEHAPFDRRDLDACIYAARSSGLPVMARIPTSDPSQVLNALDLGADGIIAPHVASAEAARNIVASARYGRGGRGYAGSTRAAGYATRAMASNLEAAKARTIIVAQIEDAEALACIDDITSCEGIDCFFIGRADLAVSLGAASINDTPVIDASRAIVASASHNNKCTGMFVGSVADCREWIDFGVSLFLLESDQTFMLKGANALAETFQSAANQPRKVTG